MSTLHIKNTKKYVWHFGYQRRRPRLSLYSLWSRGQKVAFQILAQKTISKKPRKDTAQTQNAPVDANLYHISLPKRIWTIVGSDIIESYQMGPDRNVHSDRRVAVHVGGAETHWTTQNLSNYCLEEFCAPTQHLWLYNNFPWYRDRLHLAPLLLRNTKHARQRHLWYEYQMVLWFPRPTFWHVT